MCCIHPLIIWRLRNLAGAVGNPMSDRQTMQKHSLPSEMSIRIPTLEDVSAALKSKTRREQETKNNAESKNESEVDYSPTSD